MLQVIVNVVRFELPFLYDSLLTEIIGRDGNGIIRCVNEGIGHSFWYSNSTKDSRLPLLFWQQQ